MTKKLRLMSKNHFVMAGVFVVSVMATTVSFANTEVYLEARKAMVSGEAKTAYELLIPSYNDGSVDNNSLFLLGLSSKEQGKLDESKKYFTELLAKDKNAHRVKLELADIHFRQGKKAQAKSLLLEVKATNPPTKVGANIDAFLAHIEKGDPKSWNAFASFGLMYDTNANQGPETDTVLLYNLPFNLSSDAKNQDDWANVFKLGVNHSHKLKSGATFQTGANVSFNKYRTLYSFDSLSLSLSAGPSWQKDKWSFSIPYIFNVVKIGHDDDWYSINNGLSPQFGFQVRKNVILQGNLSYSKKRYLTNSDRDGHSFMLNTSVRYSLDANRYVSASIYKGLEESGIKTSSNDSSGINLGYYHALGKLWNVYVSPSISKTDYRGVEAAYGKDREDTQLALTANINYLIKPINSNLTFSYTWTKNISSIEMYEYDRKQFMLSVFRAF